MIWHAIFLFISLLNSAYSTFQYQCVDNKCQRVIQPLHPNNVSLAVCRLICGQSSTIWPLPISANHSNVVTPINPWNTNINVQYKRSFYRQEQEIEQALQLFHTLFTQFTNTLPKSQKSDESTPLNIEATLTHKLGRLEIDMYEGYTIHKSQNSNNIRIFADNYLGYRNAIVTLLQLIAFDPIEMRVVIPDRIEITDYPKFPYRGVMIDSAHNFFDIPSMKHLLIGLSMSKVNSVHWHITDSSSFPLLTWRYPNLARYGAYSAKSIYTIADVHSMIIYAKMLGIKLIPELAVPAPMGSGWGWGSEMGLGDLVVCHSRNTHNVGCSHPPCGQLNIENENAVNIIKEVYQEMISMLGDAIYHLGGANVDTSCWSTLSQEESYRRWAKLLNDIADMIIQRGGDVIVFSNQLLYDSYEWLPSSKFIIQLTDNEDVTLTQDLLSRGYRLILSPDNRTRWDTGFGLYSPYQTVDNERQLGWHSAYNILVQNMVINSHNILGGEGLLYSYFTNGHNTEERLLLQAAGLSERFWSNPEDSYLNAFNRIGYHTVWLKYMGFHSAAVEPFWCTQNNGKCLIGE